MYISGIDQFFRIFNPTFDEWKSRFGVQSSQKRDLKNRKKLSSTPPILKHGAPPPNVKVHNSLYRIQNLYMLQRWSKEDAHYGQNTLQELIFITSYMNFILVQKICFPESFSGRWETWGGRNVLPFWQYCRNKHFDQYWYYGQNWYFCQIDIFVKIDIFIKIDIFVKIDNFVKIVFLTISSTVFDDFINYRQLYQLLIFSSTIWSKYQMSVLVNCNLA